MAGGSPSRNTRSWTAMFRLSWRQRLTFALAGVVARLRTRRSFLFHPARHGGLGAPVPSRSQFLARTGGQDGGTDAADHQHARGPNSVATPPDASLTNLVTRASSVFAPRSRPFASSERSGNRSALFARWAERALQSNASSSAGSLSVKAAISWAVELTSADICLRSSVESSIGTSISRVIGCLLPSIDVAAAARGANEGGLGREGRAGRRARGGASSCIFALVK